MNHIPLPKRAYTLDVRERDNNSPLALRDFSAKPNLI